MNVPKLARFLVLSLILTAVAVPAYAARACSCDFCQQVPSNVPCVLDGATTTCGAFLIVALCPAPPAQGEPSVTMSALLAAASEEPAAPACELQ